MCYWSTIHTSYLVWRTTRSRYHVDFSWKKKTVFSCSWFNKRPNNLKNLNNQGCFQLPTDMKLPTVSKKNTRNRIVADKCLVMYLCQGWIWRHRQKLWHRDLLWSHEMGLVAKPSRWNVTQAGDNLHILKFISYPKKNTTILNSLIRLFC